MRREHHLVAAVGAATIVALAVPASALAHVGNIEYRFPLPIWMYALGGALVVLLSAPTAAVGLRKEAWVGRTNLYPRLRSFLPGAFLRALALALLALVLVSGLFPTFGVNNPGVLLVWVDFWVGLGLVSALVANVWDFISPLSYLGRALDGHLARRGAAARPYPAELGVWPSFVLLLAFSWVELVWSEAREPKILSAMVFLYCALQLLGMARYGAEVWLARAELFTVFARTLARVAPIEIYARATDEPCRAGICENGPERLGCPTCFLDAPHDDRGVRFRAYGAGILRDPPLDGGGAAFVVGLLATVVFDGLRGTRQYARLESSLVDLLPGLGDLRQTRSTFMMVLIVAAFALVYMLAAWVAARFEPGGTAAIAGRYAPTLIPIAAAYFVAHYALYLFYVGQLTPRVVLDPSDSGWFPDYQPWTSIPGAAVWALQLAVIVAGHLIAVAAAHRVAQPFHRGARRVLVAQLPLLALMVLYTFTGLWVLGQALQGQT